VDLQSWIRIPSPSPTPVPYGARSRWVGHTPSDRAHRMAVGERFGEHGLLQRTRIVSRSQGEEPFTPNPGDASDTAMFVRDAQMPAVVPVSPYPCPPPFPCAML